MVVGAAVRRRFDIPAVHLCAACVALLLVSGCGCGSGSQTSTPIPSEASPCSSRHQSKRFFQVRHVYDPLGFSFTYETPDFMTMHEGSHGISADSLGRLVMDESSDQHVAVTILANSEDDPSCVLMVLVPEPTPRWYRSAWRGMTKAQAVNQLPATARYLKASFGEQSEFSDSKLKAEIGLTDGIPSVTLRVDVRSMSPGADGHVWLRYLCTRKRYYVVFWTQDGRATYRDTVKLAEIARSVKVTW